MVDSARDPSPAALPTEDLLSKTDWLSLIDDADREGEFLKSYDLATRALTFHPADVWLQHRAVLALARGGATNRAQQLFGEYGLNQRTEEDIAALGARLAKDYALASRAADRAIRASVAALLYENTFRRTGGFYSGINAATMWLLAGHRPQAEDLAEIVRDICRRTSEQSDNAYYLNATAAEAALVLNDIDSARTALERAMRHSRQDRGAVAATRRQLRLVCEINAIDLSILEPLAAETVVHYTGHMIGRLVPQYEHLIAQRIREYLDTRSIGFAYGSLASGADILFAEALLRRGVELHVVLPCDVERFITMSVAKAGREWIPRFNGCREAARSIRFASDDMVSNDDSGLAYAAAVAMGLAVTRARQLDTSVEQLAVWDGRSRSGTPTGTEADMALWRRAGYATRVIVCPPAADVARDARTRDDTSPRRLPRSVRAFLFGDVKGFSKLQEEQLPRFIDGIMLRIAAVLDRYGADLLSRNTWGDGVFLVFRDAAPAATCALDVQDALRDLDLSELSLPTGLALRLGGHAGPVFEVVDPVLKQPAFLGSHITRTARIEPITPEGEVYVTEQFAALLALEPDTTLRSEYVGHMPTAKGYGTLRMYVLKRDVHA
jgi:Tetratricopeptide Repeats-Sensor/Adenylate and Guanylate cyclase catalytic domain